MKKKFLVVYDYGQGGLWAFLRARSKEEIEARFPELKVVADTPSWMSGELRCEIEERETYDLDESPRGLLADVLRARTES